MKKNLAKAVFLDRDGVINMNRDDYVKNNNEFVFLPNSINGIKKLIHMGYLTIVITNQSVVNRGIISKKQLEKIHEFMVNKMEKESCKITKIYYCPHRPDENCNCRKPKPSLILKAVKDYNVDVKNSWLIGDASTDIQAAESVGLRSIKIKRDGNIMDAINIIQGYLN